MSPNVRSAVVVAAFVALLGVAVTVFVVRARAMDILGDPDQGRVGWLVLLRPAMFFAAGALLAGTVLFVGLRLMRRPLPGWRMVLAAVTGVVAVALAATTPIAVAYEDGCNGHRDVAPAIAVPYLKAARPEDSQLSYFGFVTTVACIPGPLPSEAGPTLPVPVK